MDVCAVPMAFTLCAGVPKPFTLGAGVLKAFTLGAGVLEREIGRVIDASALQHPVSGRCEAKEATGKHTSDPGSQEHAKYAG